MLFLHTLVLSLAIVSSVPLNDFEVEWREFQDQFDRRYESPEEVALRKNIFRVNLEDIRKHNTEFEAGRVSYRKAINRFADRTDDELRMATGLALPSLREMATQRSRLFRASGAQVPESIDYRQLGAVTPVKDQHHCGSCWAFATIGSIEGQYFLATKKLVSFSEQQLMDCSKHNDGCCGGLTWWAFDDLKKMGGVVSNESYPYTATKHRCSFKKKTALAKIKGYTLIEDGDEEALMEAIALHGPIPVAVAVTSSFQAYSEGIFEDDSCGEMLNHAVLVVGYGSENGSDYWTVKNSWGTGWGEEGYIRISRSNDTCQPLWYPIVPSVKPIIP